MTAYSDLRRRQFGFALGMIRNAIVRLWLDWSNRLRWPALVGLSSAHLMRVTKWATKKAGLDEAEAQEHVLQISGTRIQPPLNAHLGSLNIRGCEIEFDLVRKQLVQG